VDEARINAHLTSRVLIKRGFRVPIVTRITGLSAEIVRGVYREVTGRMAKPGPVPGPMSLVETNRTRAATSLYLTFYARYAPDTQNVLDIDWRAVVLAYDAYERVVPAELRILEINAAWVAATGFRSKTFEISHCTKCHTEYVTCASYERRAFTSCPICALQDRAGRTKIAA